MPSIFSADPALLSDASKLNYNNSKIHIGTIATSDYFPDPTNVITSITTMHANAIEMEGAAVMQVCAIFHTPCIVFRGVSDIVSNNNQTQSTSTKNPEQTAIQNVSAYTLAFINQLT